jgi:hypothetical protein
MSRVKRNTRELTTDMKNEDTKSKRSMKREIAGDLRRIRKDAAWKTPPSADAEMALRELDQSERTARVLGEADTCQACGEERESQGDLSALCRAHLSEAMGFSF